MTCREAEPLLNARLDNELDAASALSIERHMDECRACAAQYAALERLREEIGTADLSFVPPPGLRSRIQRRRAPSLPKSWMLALGAAACVLLGVALGSLLLPKPIADADALSAEILDQHLRSLLADHLVDVPSSNRHTVKPWFQGKTSFSPPVPDLADEGFALDGGRLEMIHRQPGAAIVYRRGQHVISLYVAPDAVADTAPRILETGGYRMLIWTQAQLRFWAVSDLNAAELKEFGELVRRAK